MANNLKDHLKEVADAIRAKKGTSDLINPQDFAAEIEGISGGGESGGSNIEYLDVSGLETTMRNQLLLFAILARTKEFEWNNQPQEKRISLMGEQTLMVLVDASFYNLFTEAVEALSIDFAIKLVSASGGEETVLDALKYLPVYDQLDSIPRLTKEQFYDLNA